MRQQHRHYARREVLLRSVIAVVTLFTTNGCITSSVRYTRPAATSNDAVARRTTVPRDWDYRKHYTVPNDRLKRVAEGYLGTPYRYGGMSRRGVDCSGLVCLVFSEVSRAKLPHSTRALRRLGKKVSFQSAKGGDLVFFRGGAFGVVNHVGIYMARGAFIHASLKKGVVYSSLEDPYYQKRFVEIRRVF